MLNYSLSAMEIVIKELKKETGTQYTGLAK
jgi:hypothetical protein